MYFTVYNSPVGLLTLSSDKNSLTGLWNKGQKYHGSTHSMMQNDDLQIFAKAKAWLDAYFAGKSPSLSTLPLNPAGTEFRKSIWDILCKIPYGKVVTYKDVAKEFALMANKLSVSSRAVGGAVGHNPISIIIPCHRVLGANGKLTGYAGGISTKLKLLRLEGVDMSSLVVPNDKDIL